MMTPEEIERKLDALHNDCERLRQELRDERHERRTELAAAIRALPRSDNDQRPIKAPNGNWILTESPLDRMAANLEAGRAANVGPTVRTSDDHPNMTQTSRFRASQPNESQAPNKFTAPELHLLDVCHKLTLPSEARETINSRLGFKLLAHQIDGIFKRLEKRGLVGSHGFRSKRLWLTTEKGRQAYADFGSHLSQSEDPQP